MTTERLKESLGKLQRNIDGVGLENLRKKYAAAFERLLAEIKLLINAELAEGVYPYATLIDESKKSEYESIICQAKEKCNSLLEEGTTDIFQTIEAALLDYAEKVVENYVMPESKETNDVSESQENIETADTVVENEEDISEEESTEEEVA